MGQPSACWLELAASGRTPAARYLDVRVLGMSIHTRRASARGERDCERRWFRKTPLEGVRFGYWQVYWVGQERQRGTTLAMSGLFSGGVVVAMCWLGLS